MDDAKADAALSDLVDGLRRIEPATRGLAAGRAAHRRSRHQLLVQASVIGALVAGGTAVGIGTGTIPFGEWTTKDGNTYVDTTGDGVPDEVHAAPTRGGRLTCSLVGLTATEANGFLQSLDLKPEWHLGLVDPSDPFVTKDGGVVSQPPPAAIVSDFTEANGIVRVTADVGDYALQAAPAQGPNTCAPPAR